MLASLLVPFVALTLAPIDTIRVGDPSVLATLSPGVETVDNFIIRDGERHPAVTFVQAITEVPEGYRIVQENKSPDGTILTLDTITVAKGTLATVWHGDVTPMGKRHVTFWKGRMKGVAVDTLDQPTRIDAAIPSGLFDYSIMTLVADRLPLEEGYKATIATYDITRGEVYVPIEVVGAESIRVEGIEYDTWRMEIDVSGRKVSRWVDRGSRKEIRWSVTFNGREMIGERRHE